MPYQLVVLKGRSASSVLRIPPESVTIVGRQQGCQIRIVSSLVSRKHCELTERGGTLRIRDLGSSNGTYVNGQRIEGTKELEPGFSLVIGSVVFRVDSARPAGSAEEPTVQSGTTPADTSVPLAETVAVDEIDFEIEAESASNVATPVQRPGKAATPAAAEETSEVQQLGEDAVADFLFDLNVDDQDKR